MTAGTDTDSRTVPNVCVGNTPYNFACPHKYLNAEFYRLDILTAGETWQPVVDGAQIPVPAGLPLYARVRIGNTGEAKWIAQSPDNQGIAKLGGNENFGTTSFRQAVPYDVLPGQDVIMDRVLVSSGITSTQTVAFQMSSSGRAWFGEQVTASLILTAPLFGVPSCISWHSMNINNCVDAWGDTIPSRECTTEQATVTLKNYSPRATQMRFINKPFATYCSDVSVGDTGWSSWETHSSMKAWQMSGGDSGLRKVCVQYQNQNGASSVCGAGIGYESTISPTTTPTPTSTLTPTPTSTPVPGDVTGDRKVNVADILKLLTQWQNPYTIFDYNLTVVNYGRP